MKAFLLGLVLTFFAAAPATAQNSSEEHGLMIDVGRNGVMLGQIEEYAGSPDPIEQSAANVALDLARALREDVWALNLKRSQLCAAGRFVAVTCVPAFAPSWLSERPDRRVSIRTLDQRNSALRGEINEVLGPVCDEARAKVTDPQERMYICAME